MHILLTYLGIVPFLFFGIIAQLLPKSHLIDSQWALHAYSLCIISFIAGSHWGLQNGRPMIAILSNMVTVCAWASMILSPLWINITHGLLFIALLFIDRILQQSQNITQHYFQTRIQVSFIVIGVLALNGLLIT